MKPRAMYYGIGGLEMAVYRLLDVVLSEGSLRMDEKARPVGPLYGAIYSRWRAHEDSAGMAGETTDVKWVKSAPMGSTGKQRDGGGLKWLYIGSLM